MKRGGKSPFARCLFTCWTCVVVKMRRASPDLVSIGTHSCAGASSRSCCSRLRAVWRQLYFLLVVLTATRPTSAGTSMNVSATIARRRRNRLIGWGAALAASTVRACVAELTVTGQAENFVLSFWSLLPFVVDVVVALVCVCCSYGGGLHARVVAGVD